MSSERVCIILSSAFPNRLTGTGYAALSLFPVVAEEFDKVYYITIANPEHQKPPTDFFSNVEFRIIHALAYPKPVRFIRSMVSRYPAIVQRYLNPETITEINTVLDNHRHVTAIVLDSPLFWPLHQSDTLKKRFQKVILWNQNVTSIAFEGVIKNCGPLLKPLWKWEIERLAKYEKSSVTMANNLWVISKEDGNTINQLFGQPVGAVCSVRIADEFFTRQAEGDPHTILYLGSFDTRKADGIDHFVHSVFPIIRDQIPEAKLFLGGRGSEVYNNPTNHVYGLGFVEDAEAFMKQGLIVVNPQSSGSGIKIKSLLAMASAKTLVTTSIGIQGIAAQADQDYLLMTDSAGSATKLLNSMRQPAKLREIACNGQSFIKQNYNTADFDANLRNLLSLDSH